MIQRIHDSGEVAKTYRYDAFGNEETPEPLDANPFRYCGEYFDAETATLYLRARSYDPHTGRFTQEDPAGDGANWYAYCANNPILLVDPSGHAAKETGKAPTNRWKEAWDKALPYYLEGTGPKNQYKSFVKARYEGVKFVKGLTTNLRGTYSVGVTGNASILGLAQGGVSIVTTKDFHGNNELQFTVYGNGTVGEGVPDMRTDATMNNAANGKLKSVSLSGSAMVAFTNAPKAENLRKEAQQIGGSYGRGLVLGGDWLTMSDQQSGETYHGISVTAGSGVSAEVHAGESYTITIPGAQSNHFQLEEQFYNWVMGW